MLTSRLSANYEHENLVEGHPNVLSIHGHSTPLNVSRYPADHGTMTLHIEAACRYGGYIERAAMRHGLLPSIIAGFGSRQSGWGLNLSPAGHEGSTDFAPRLHRTTVRQGLLPEDGYGFGRGLMQLDYDRHEIARLKGWQDPEANIEAACEVISSHRSYLRKRTMLQGFGLLRAAFSAFDCGLEQVQNAARQGLDIDSPTAGRDYGRDILERAGFFQRNGWD